MLIGKGHHKACITHVIITGTVQLTDSITDPVAFGDIGFLPAMGANDSHSSTVCNIRSGV